MATIQQKLDYIADLQASLDILRLEKQALIDQIITPEIKAKIDEIEAEFSPKVEAANTAIAVMEAEVKQNVIENGASVKGAHLQAVYAKGRTSWDGKLLEGLAIALPEINKAKTVGQPSVSIRKI